MGQSFAEYKKQQHFKNTTQEYLAKLVFRQK